MTPGVYSSDEANNRASNEVRDTFLLRFARKLFAPSCLQQDWINQYYNRVNTYCHKTAMKAFRLYH